MTEQFKRIDPALIDPSPTNARSYFGDIAELTVNVKESGVIEPLIVRPKGKARFELVCGERRWRAAKAAELKDVPCVIRDLTDAEALDQQTIENLLRNDLKPLEQAKQFRLHINKKLDKHAAETLAAKVGKSASWIWDVMKVLDLIPEAKALLEKDRMTLNHAIPIARLTPAQQKKVIDPTSGGLFERESAHALSFLTADEEDAEESKDKKDPYRGRKTRSVRELNSWINEHIRFDVKQQAQAAPFLFENTAQAVETAQAREGRGNHLLPITYSWVLKEDARDSAQRTYGVNSWKRADGSDKDSPTCDFSVLGVVVAGPDRGKSFEVCVNREKCRVHFGDVIKEKETRAAAKASGQPSKQDAADLKYKEEQRRKQEEKQKRDAHWRVFYPALRKAMEAKLAALPTNLPSALFQALLKELRLPKTTKPADLARTLLVRDINSDIARNDRDSYWEHGAKQMIEAAKLIGVNIKACEPKAEPKAKPAKAATKATAKKKVARKK